MLNTISDILIKLNKIQEIAYYYFLNFVNKVQSIVSIINTEGRSVCAEKNINFNSQPGTGLNCIADGW